MSIRQTLALSLGALCLALCVPARAALADDDIVLVPFAPNNLELPHPVHENARITLKGIVRNASCDSYRVIWDTDRDGAFETDGQDAMRSASPWNGTLYDISVYYEVPDVPGTADQRWPINVQVYNNCTGKESLATYKLFVYNWSPTPDPRAWKKDQIDVMSQVAIQESLWYLHRRMVRSGTNAQMTGYPASGGNTFAGAALAAWAFSINGHGPAFPTAGYNTYGFTMPDNWSATNKYRWDSNPYAETVARIVNQVLANGTGWVGINGADESSECGVDVLSTGSYRTRNCNRLPGTTNNSGAYTNGASNNVYYHGVSTSALASVLPSLVGTPLQTGGLAGMRWENFIQELTDYMGYMQIDGGCADGGWYYSAFDGGGDCIYMDASTAQWAYIGLESAEVLGRPFGVIVTNRHKYRSAYAAVANLNNNGAAQYRTSGHGTNNLMLTGGSILVARWLEFDKLPTSGGANNATPFPYSGYRVNDYRQAMSKMRSFTSNNWTSTTVAPYYNGGLFWSTGSYLCGNTSSVYRWSGSGCGNLYAIYSHQKAYRTGIPEELSPRVLDGFTWDQQFAISTMRAQYRDRGDFDNGNWGYIHDCDVGSMINCNYGGVSFSTAVGVLILTPTLFNPKPVALASITPAVVYEGCSNSNASTLTFNHSASFHPSPDARIVAYQWDVDKSANGGGLWWNTPGARADFEVGATHTTAGGQVIPGASVPFIYSYQRSGSYVATLRVVDSTNQEKLTELPVTVLPVPNEAPSVNHGGPYILEAGDALTLRGSASDNNAGCGDTLSVAWDLDGDNAFNDLSAAAGTIPWSKFSAFQYGRAYNIKLRARDSAGAEVSTITQLTIYPKEPVAVATAVPNPAQCQQEISFSGANSFHLNPNRRITQYAWDVDANLNPGVDGGGVRFAYAYPRFGTYDVTLKVTDDLGRSHTVSGLKVNVNQGNSAPVARVAAARVTRIELQDIVLDASPSYDANANCGDAITRYEWDLDGDGRFGGARDVTTQQSRVVLPWADASVRLGWNGVDLSLQRRLTARVTDTFGAQSTAQVELTVYKADPVARFDQRPSPAPIDLQTGLVQVTLDARESYSPIPTGAITNYEWDFDCADNAPQFVDAVGQPVVTYRRIFENVSPNSVPRPLVCLRVTDHRGTKVWIQKPILYGVGDVPPTADADPSDSPEVGYHVLLGGDLRLSGAQSIEPNKDDFIKFYRWRVNYSANENPDTLVNWDVVARDDNGDGLEAVSAVTAARLAQLGVGALGTYPLVMEVEDTTFLSARDRSTLTVHPVNPVASAVVDPTVAACGQRLTLDASASGHSHPFIDIVEWAWDMNNNGSFNDAVDARGERTTVTASQFTFNGPVPVMLRVTDSEGHQATTQVNLAVTQGNSAPSANAGGPYVVAIGDAAVALNGGGTVDPNAQCGDAVVSLRWDIGNNGTFEAQYDNNPTPTLTWQQLTQLLGTGNKGRYAVRLQARDRFGATSEHVVNLDIVQGPTALAAVTPSRPACNAQVELNGGGSSTDGPLDNGFALVRYQWDLTNDGTFDAEGVSVLRNAVGDGPVTARLRVTDASNRTSEATAVYTISNNNLPPVGNAGGPYATTILNGVRQPVTLDARATVDPNAPCDAVARYEWDTDNDGLFGANDTNGVAGVGNSDAVGALVENHVNSQWRVGLSYIVRLRTCDTKGACSVVEADLTVSDNAPPTGEIVYPRASDCVANVQFPLQIKLKDLEGGAVTVRVLVDNVSVHQSSVQVQPNVQKTHTITLDAGRFAEGFRALTVEMVDDRNGRSVMNSGGPVPFDRTAPSLSISSALIANACYRLAEVPSLNIAASDAVDPAPIIHETTTANSCRRLLSVEAVDRCGNRKVIDRQYRVAEAVPFTLNGPAEGSLVGSGAFTWALDESCANPLSATLAEAGATRAYAAGALINVPGAYTFTLNVPNCVGEVVQARRAFTVNAPPVAVAVPSGHPNADSLAQVPTYVAVEGSPLRVEADDSRPPEVEDSLSTYRWDFNGDGVFDVSGAAAAAARVPFPTDEDGVFTGRLEVVDSFGLTSGQSFEVLIDDVHPSVNAGGPYNPAQGEAQRFDASLSRAANAADPLSRVVWRWGDGTPDTVAAPPAGLTPTHVFERDGQYEVRLTVHDEDSSRSQVVQVSVRDVPPTFGPNGVTVAPQEPYALQEVTFTVDARAGAPADPIVSYDFDFLGNGRFEQYPGAEVRYQYLEAGRYTVTLLVRDEDSFARTSFPLTVRAVTLSDILREVDAAVARLEAAGGPARALSALNPDGQRDAHAWVAQGLWAEQMRDAAAGAGVEASRMQSLYRGSTLMAFDELLFRLNRAQSAGADLGNLLWKVSRQLLRETESYAAQVLASDVNALLSRSYQQAQVYLGAARAIFTNVDFKDRVGARDGFLARDLFAAISEAHFSLRGYSDLATVHGGFPMPTRGDVITRLFAANEPNAHVLASFNQLAGELASYLADADDAARPGPGVAEIARAAATLDDLRALVAQPILSPCLNNPDADLEAPECAAIDDLDSLRLQLGLMDLITDLFAAADQGVYVRSAQSMLTLAVRFRVEVALLSVQDECGVRSPLLVGARAQQEIMLNLLERGQSDAALLYYIAPERRCLVVQIYNECVVPARNVGADPAELLSEEPYPDTCEGVGFGGEGGGGLFSFEPPIAFREPLDDLFLLYKIVSAFVQRVDLARAAELARFAPEYTWADVNRFFVDNAFNISDVDTAITQFNHDVLDADGDGLLGLIEIDCRVRYNVPLNPMRANSTGVPDGEVDCDGDGIPNAEELAIGLNPVAQADAALDTDGDGVTNYREWLWAKRGLALDIRDPLDVRLDHDSDGIPDGLEIRNDLDPTLTTDARADFDADGLTNAQEVLNGLNPRDASDANADPDGDGLTSREEVARGRDPLVADCESDAVELVGRDDDALSARPLALVGDPARASFGGGTICGARGSEDVDWFSVTIDVEQARLAAHVRGADGPNADLALRLYRKLDLAQIATSDTRFEGEVVVASRGQLEAGEYLLRVSHAAGDAAPESPYVLDVMVVEATLPCLPDSFEGAQTNDRLSAATVVSGELRRGDVWVCDAERNTGDWFRVDVQGVDRTVHISYAPNTDGKLELSAMTQDLSSYAESRDVQKSAQCLNLRASGSPAAVFVNVTAASIFADGDGRVDYTLQVVETDLDANPRGACDELNRGLFGFHPWPTLALP